MKTEWSYTSCQHRSESLHAANGAGDMGLQPQRPMHNAPPNYRSTLTPSPVAMDQRCNCVCAQLPDDRTILHGILTGQGYKYGYGTAFETPFFQTAIGYRSKEDMFMNLEPLQHEVHSQEVSSASRYITPQADK